MFKLRVWESSMEVGGIFFSGGLTTTHVHPVNKIKAAK